MLDLVRMATRPASADPADDAAARERRLAASPPVNPIRILRILALTWLGFTLILLSLDILLVAYRPGATIWPARYYLANAAVPLLLLGLSQADRLAAGEGQILTRIFIIASAVTPAPIIMLAISQPSPGMLTAANGVVNVRTLPIIFLGLILIALNYQWRHVVVYTLIGISMTLLCLLASGNGTTQSISFAIATAMVFLAIGYCLCMLMGRLHAQSHALQQANARLRRHASALESLTISRERNRLARELHDTLAHRLSALAVQLETASAYLHVDLGVVQELMDAALLSARGGLNETRRALLALRASPLDDLGLEFALRELAASAANAGPLEIKLAIADPLPELAPDIEQCVYRVAQEAVANTLQHANATTLRITLGWERQRLALSIHDNGIGFTLAQPAIQGHFGLAGMDERATLAGGRLTIDTMPGAGTAVTLEILL